MLSMAIHSFQKNVSVIMMVSVTILVSRGTKNDQCVNSQKTEYEAEAEDIEGRTISTFIQGRCGKAYMGI